jgi:hypothetical protein
MKKIFRVEIELEVEEIHQQSVILAARSSYREGGGAEEPVNDRSDDCRCISAEEFIPDTIGALMELVLDNPVLHKAGINVVEASCHEVKGVRNYDAHRYVWP